MHEATCRPHASDFRKFRQSMNTFQRVEELGAVQTLFRVGGLGVRRAGRARPISASFGSIGTPVLCRERTVYSI